MRSSLSKNVRGQNEESHNPFSRPREIRKMVLDNVQLTPRIQFNGKGFVCALITSRCPLGCEYCMFSANMAEGKNEFNTMTPARVSKLMKLVEDANAGYLLVSGGGEPFLEPHLIYQIVEESSADLTWIVTSAFWAKRKSKAIEIISNMYRAFLRGNKCRPNRRVCLRVSVDSYHINRLAVGMGYIINVIKIFESFYSYQHGFFLQLHALKGEEYLIEQLRRQIGAVKSSDVSPIHKNEKATEDAIALLMPSGYKFEVTFAKLLYSDLAADLRDSELLKKRIEVWEKDAFVNERGRPACKVNSDGTLGPNMLVVYDGRVAGGWQSEMPDVPIYIDEDDYETIMRKTLSDPGVLLTIERGHAYRCKVINEVSPKSCIRAKAVNIRDYTSLVLFEEDRVKLYYTLRAIQDLIDEGRISPQDMNSWPSELKTLVLMPREHLQSLFWASGYDIIKQFEETEPGFRSFMQSIRAFVKNRNLQRFVSSVHEICGRDLRKIDKWRLLLKRIVHDWYDIESLTAEEIEMLGEVERVIDEKILKGKRIYEGLSRLHTKG